MATMRGRERDSASCIVCVSESYYTCLPCAMITLLHFHLSITLPDASMMARLSAPPAELCLDLGLVFDTGSTHLLGHQGWVSWVWVRVSTLVPMPHPYPCMQDLHIL